MMNQPLVAATPRPRHTITNRMTRYAVEVVIDGQATTIGFTERVSKMSLLMMAREQKDAILPFLTETDACTYRRGEFRLGRRVIIRATTRTERQS